MTLIDRLSKLDGPSGALDREICKHLGLLSSMTCEYNHWPLRVTSSVDACLTLAERVLPGKSIDLLREAISELGKKYHWHICLQKPEQVRELPIQVCIALLRAKDASTL